MPRKKGGRKVVSFLPSKKAGRYLLILQDGSKVQKYELTIDEATLFPLYEGKILSIEEEGLLKRSLSSSKARRKAMALLKRRSYAAKELQERLLKEETLSYPEVKETIASLLEEGLLDDERYAREKVEEGEITLKGKRRILFLLKEAGVAESILLCLDFPNEEEKAQRDLERLLPRFAPFPLNQKREKAHAALSRDGYEESVIHYVLVDLGEDEEKVRSRLLSDTRNAYLRLARKYNGRELNEKVYEALLRKGYRRTAIIEAMKGESDAID